MAVRRERAPRLTQASGENPALIDAPPGTAKPAAPSALGMSVIKEYTGASRLPPDTAPMPQLTTPPPCHIWPQSAIDRLEQKENNANQRGTNKVLPELSTSCPHACP
ncbi:MAG: hypothetical protein M0R03_21575 [Novosphingobium sp.]|nr:hypothetical protein [Novosphingobium sp.]